MGITDLDVIDMAVEEDGRLKLVIVDSGTGYAPEERLGKLAAKFKAYLRFLYSPIFKKERPNLKPDDVSIVVICSKPPSKEMLQITKVIPGGEKAVRIPVEFRKG